MEIPEAWRRQIEVEEQMNQQPREMDESVYTPRCNACKVQMVLVEEEFTGTKVVSLWGCPLCSKTIYTTSR